MSLYDCKINVVSFHVFLKMFKVCINIQEFEMYKLSTDKHN